MQISHILLSAGLVGYKDGRLRRMKTVVVVALFLHAFFAFTSWLWLTKAELQRGNTELGKANT